MYGMRKGPWIAALAVSFAASGPGCIIYNTELLPPEQGRDAGDGQGSADAGEDPDTDAGSVDAARTEESDSGECVPAEEVCNGEDDDCDGEIDEAEAAEACGFENAMSACVDGECVLVSCRGDYVDCDGDDSNGCEARIDTPQNCGACGRACRLPNAVSACDSGRCVVEQCEDGYGDCNGVTQDGCEQKLDPGERCGECSLNCDLPNVSVHGCDEQDNCTVVTCDAGYADCDTDPSNGCEVGLGTVNDCSGCGDECSGSTPYCSGGRCSAIDCAVERPGYGDCDGDGVDCETDLSPSGSGNSISDCMLCGSTCGPYFQATVSCESGVCSIYSCEAGHDDCDGQLENGCETELGTETDCSECDDECGGSTPYCSGGTCSAIDCAVERPGYGDCDCDGVDCETDLSPPGAANTVANCGACGVTCGPLANATATCASGTCEIHQCDGDYVSCDNNDANGCETDAVPGCDEATSCKALRDMGVTADGTYTIDPDGSGGPIAPFQVFCDMTTDGGGWTEINWNIARNILSGTLVAEDAASTAAFDASHRPYTRDGDDDHTYHYTFQFPCGYTQFWVKGYKAKANSPGYTSEIRGQHFIQTTWQVACRPQDQKVGDISFGTPLQNGPVVSFASTIDFDYQCAECELDFPGGETIYSVPASTAFRIGFGECGGEPEGWYPWWGGTILLR
jgi:hypothetical protein